MAKLGRSFPFSSIRYRILFLLLGLTVAATLTIIAIAVYTADSAGENAQRISSQALTTQAEKYLVQLTQSRAKEYNKTLESVLDDTQKVADYTAEVFDNPDAFSNENFWLVEEHMHYLKDGQYVNGPDDMASVYVPRTSQIDQKTLQDIKLSAYLDYLFQSVFENSANIEAIYYASPRNVVRYYPNVYLGAVLPPDFQATERVWYKGSVKDMVSAGEPWWTPPYVDATGLGLVTTSAMPVFSKSGDLIGVVGLDVTLNEIIATIKETRFSNSGYSFLIDGNGHAISLPDQGIQDIMGRPPEADEFYSDLTEINTPFAPVLEKMLAGEDGFDTINNDGRQLYIAYTPLDSTGWSLGSVVDARDVLEGLAPLQSEFERTTQSLLYRIIIPGGALAIVLTILIGVLLTNRIINPIHTLVAAVDKLRAGQYEVTFSESNDDEIGVLAQSFSTMAQQLRDLVNQLERRVSDRTRQLERRNLQIRVAAEVARDATVMRDPDELLVHAVELIRGRFGFYHTGIFLTDEKGEYAVLRAATGKAGQEMLASGHKLRISRSPHQDEHAEPVGLVGSATGTRQPRIALNVGKDKAHYKNPFLPETRSEIVLPLIVGERVIGALDVQSQYPDAFGEDDIIALQIISDQLAVAIQSAQLLAEVQESLLELETIYNQYSREQWHNLSQSRAIVGYRYDNQVVSPLQKSSPDDWKSSPSAPQPFRIPLQVRGQVIGQVDFWPKGEEIQYHEIDLIESIGARLSQALESARLFEEIQLQASREQMVGEITGRIRETLDIDTVLHTAAQEIYQALGLKDVIITLDNHLDGRVDKQHSYEEHS
jgi:GAF domain-containing protein/HAMP domain-containing protein